MKFCDDCFKYEEIKSMIKSNGNRGDCSLNTEHKNRFICDLQEDKDSVKEIKNILKQIIEIYKVDDDLPADFPAHKKNLLKDALVKKWSLFNIDDEKIQHLLEALFREDKEFNHKLLSASVGVEEELNNNDEDLIIENNDWNEFSNSLKFKNRFHTQSFNKRIFETFLQVTLKQLHPEENTYYRARIDNENNLSIEEMNAPPKEIASPGRLNSQWISSLYLIDRMESSLKEVRASFYDTVFIGHFKLNKSMWVVDLRNFEDVTLHPEIEYLTYYLNRDILKKIHKGLTEPLSKDTKDISYLPLQYISDYIKTLDIGHGEKCAGIMYKSVMEENSANLMLFNGDNAKCFDVEQKTIKEVIYRAH